jgi:hypothetical protein
MLGQVNGHCVSFILEGCLFFTVSVNLLTNPRLSHLLRNLICLRNYKGLGAWSRYRQTSVIRGGMSMATQLPVASGAEDQLREVSGGGLKAAHIALSSAAPRGTTIRTYASFSY